MLKPDAYVVTASGDSEHLSFIELDRSTESLRVIHKKAVVYIDCWRSGTEQAKEGLFPRVVFIVPDEHRKAGVVDTLAKLDPDSWQLFQVVTSDQAVTALTGRAPPERRAELKTTSE